MSASELTVVPWTGEVLELEDLSTERIAGLLDETRVFEYDRLRAFKRQLQDALLAVMDTRAEWTLHLPDGTTVSGDSPSRIDVDVDLLIKALERLVIAGTLSEDAAEKALRFREIIEPSASGLKALKKLGGTVAAEIEACEHPSTKPRAVRITRSGS